MRLKHIKLAGFKSFVDQTKVPFEHDMTAIVGPNGCGKSNIIDAVRWVLGESSAKNLRGDAMTDVIFNGATTRKAVGQASVELVFDNIAGRLHDSMADRNEVSIRRVVNRDSQNTYYLNGTKCRRRDITDIFLGTGLGPRSYAIIEQGTISRLIESKPQELRIFIEEAAGISKYKERRRDTENRIKHTRENLERLTDIRFELGQQIEHLHQQAEAAIRYKTLKTAERKYKAELAFLKWQKFNQQSIEIQTKYQKVADQIRQHEQQHKDQNFALVSTKQQLKSASEQLQHEQQQKLQLAQKAAAAEQRVKNFQQQEQKIKRDQALSQQQLTNAQAALLAAQNNVQQFNKQLNSSEPKHALVIANSKLLQETLDEKVDAQRKTQSAWQALLREQQINRAEQIAYNKQLHQHESRITHLREQLCVITERLADTNKQIETFENDELIDLSTLQSNEPLLVAQIEAQKMALTQYMQESNEASIEYGQLKGAINTVSSTIEELDMQKDQLQQWQKTQQKWLVEQNKTLLSLHDQITVAQGWGKAVEMVLAEMLNTNIVAEWPTANTPDILRLVKTSKLLSKAVISNTLASKVTLQDTAKTILLPILNNVLLADNYDEAVKLLPILEPHQSVICIDGTWLGHHFLSKGLCSTEQSYLQQQDKIDQLNAALLTKQAALEQLLVKQQVQSENITQAKALLNQHELQLRSLQQQITEKRQQQALTEQRQQQVLKYKADLTTEIHTLNESLSEEQQVLFRFKCSSSNKGELEKQRNLSAGVSTIDSATAVKSETTHNLANEQSDILESKNNQLLNEIQALQEKQRMLQQEKHELELSLEQTKQQYQHAQQNVERYHETITQLGEQQQLHNQLLEEVTAPFIEDEHQLQRWLTQLAEIENNISELHQKINEHEQNLAHNEQKQQQQLNQIEQLKLQLNQLNLDHESARLRAENAQEQLAEMGQNLANIEKNMPDNAKENQWQAELIRLGKNIAQLGAINLAAIDEYNSQLSRKNYLDQQDEDLNLAVSTLESAIAKIDRESRQKFKATFDQVNIDLQQLFPKVFGGGQAYLTLTGEDLLDTGVTIMARPPGKKNSTIHLLSGGEKALTALSLVFAIFRLNPAPFCMLDEVDAPLDDANVGRFCNLVKEMSKTVQFVYISHNKIAMEMATHLTGVTMFEAGVSRIVSVDIDEAIAMADVS